MGDHRASIKIKMEFHGVKDDCDMWINYSPTDCCNMDERVIEFFNSVYERGMEKYDEIIEESHREDRERQEREQYELLKKKFEK